MTEHINGSVTNIRMRPESVSVPKLARHINLFLDSISPDSPFAGSGPDSLNPFGSPYLRVMVWGAPGVGKSRDLQAIVDAFGKERSLLISGSDLNAEATASPAIELLRRAKQTGELAVLAIDDFDSPESASVATLFGPLEPIDESQRGERPLQGVGDQTAPTQSGEGAPSHEDGGLEAPSQHLSTYEAFQRALAEGTDAHVAGRSALAALRKSRSKPVSASHIGGTRILEAVKAERVPALVICSTSSGPTALSAVGPLTAIFDQTTYAALPSRAALRDTWDRAVAELPTSLDIDTEELAALSEGLTAHDIVAVVRRAVTTACVAQNRSLTQFTIGQTDLLAPLTATKPSYIKWADPSEGRRPEFVFAGGEVQQRSPLAVIAADSARVERGVELRKRYLPDALMQAALSELSTSAEDSAEGGWDSLLNGGLN